MLEAAIIHAPTVSDGRLDVGRILEAMLYYDRVHIIINAAFFLDLLKQLSVSDIISLLGHPGVTATFTPEFTGIRTQTKYGLTTYAPVALRITGRYGEIIPDHDDVGSILYVAKNNATLPQLTRADITKIIKITKKSRYSKILGSEFRQRARFSALARDPQTLKLFLKGIIESQDKEIDTRKLAQMTIQTYESAGETLILSNLAPHEVTNNWRGELDWNTVLQRVHEYSIEAYLSSNYSADIVTTEEVERVAAQRFDLTIERARRNSNQISAFEEMVFEETHSFSKAFNDGVITLKESLNLIDQSRRFRTWTRSLPPDANIIAEYNRAITRETVLKHFPLNVLRFVLFNSAGKLADLGIMPGAGLGLSAFDTFVLDRLIAGWRPNVFVRTIQRRIESARLRDISRRG